ncbi:uncharacterized protein LOC125499806 [Athalia rosae]|uniref:uncharacterized protein LOC125499806 n=1 Tax=Athalia rosae TaxID=37344 RepID=UPI002033B3F9|nr:uncharacterized protein LOC125499806 [Athalia rosae]
MYILRGNVVIVPAMMFLFTIGRVDSLDAFRQRTLISDILDSKTVEKFAIKLLDNVEKSKVIQINDFASIETIGNSTYESASIERREARFFEKLNDVIRTKSLNLNFGIFDLKLFRNKDSELNVDLKLDPRKSKDKKGGGILLPLLIGLKATAFVVGTVSIIALLTLKAFIASKTAILIATVLGLKKLFGGHHKTTYEAVYDGYSSGGPDYHYANEHHYEPEIFKGHPEIPEQKILGVYDLLKDQSELVQDNKEPPKFEFNAQELQGGPELMKSPDYGPQHFGESMQQDFKIDNHQKRRSWMMINNGKRKPLSLVIGSPHHEPPVLAYRKVVTGRNS